LRVAEENLMELDKAGMVSKISWRLIPLLFLCYIIAYIDRINVSFVGLHLKEAFGLDGSSYKAVFGLGSGLFFIGYFLFEVPSNLILHRIGARIWIARIMIFWGIISSATMFIKGPTGFYLMRFLLGVAEAGFFPGIILYLTYWFCARDRARTVALFSTAATLAGTFNSPICGKLLQLDGFKGLAGWQWLFLIEGIPAVLVGILVMCVLPNGPRQVRWLSEKEKGALLADLAEEELQAGFGKKRSLGEVFTSGRVWILCAIYFLLNVGGYGCEMWLPQIIRSFSKLGDFWVGLLNGIPYLAATIFMVLNGRHSDRSGDRRLHVAASALMGAFGFIACAYTHNVVLSLAALALAFAGVKGMVGPFWALSTACLGGTAAAAGIAWINSVGNLGGFVGPTIVGYLKKEPDNYTAAFVALGCALVILACIAIVLRPNAEELREEQSAAINRGKS
jgi:MFS transporter, ACS family, tartrate transporter